MSRSFLDIVLNKDDDKPRVPSIDSSPTQTISVDPSRPHNSVASPPIMGTSPNLPPSNSVDSSSTPGILAGGPQPPTVSFALPPLRPSQPSSQTMAPNQRIMPEDFEAAVILACMKDDEKDRSVSRAKTSTGAMNQQGIAGAGPSRHPTPPSVRKHIANVHRTIGGRPPKNCPLEVWDEYYKKFKAENDRQGVESAENSWTQLAKGEQFIEKMRHRPFPQFGNSSEEDELPKGVLPAIPATRRGQTERSQATSKKDLRKSAQPVKSATGYGQQVSKAEDEAAASLTALAQAQPAKQSSADSPQAQSDMKPKRRRTGPESLRSSLGKNWEAQVDEDGHRPARRGRKN